DITMYINSPGGSVHDMLAIYDTMQYVHCDIVTVCLGEAASAAAILLAGGTPGKRAALPNATILIHQPRTGGAYQGQVSDLEIQANEIERIRHRLDEILARHTGQDPEKIRRDTDRDNILTAEQAKDYGIVDELGYLSDAVDAAAKAAGIEGEPSVVYPRPPRRSLGEWFVGGLAHSFARALANESTLTLRFLP
ncbi:MAG: ATP-dependent Clp protease proteolytic subunit, partial [Myxococcales bacterium]|nr:ATP-dependent Clp protease proteolytic subunit [Myxococcales bacterium]